MMNRREHAATIAAGMLCANSLPHLATAVTGHRHLTPVGGAQSAPWTNAAWGTANLLAGLALARRAAGGEGRWDSRLVTFDLGAAVFATWMVSSEAAMRVNWRGKDDR
ncbi:hypothetical protein [Brachybacterium tyrofermentans]|uniref:hypothetical protein n=1 Tax=Brachybacterium tyrofermentans TaxID=47848 RepID=UPI000A1B315A|nr:hypothetical protein [Brachybacterium tyrofermentans]SLN01739.1 hypothetical protein FM103_10335 [Corynebacterium xerosis]